MSTGVLQSPFNLDGSNGEVGIYFLVRVKQVVNPCHKNTIWDTDNENVGDVLIEGGSSSGAAVVMAAQYCLNLGNQRVKNSMVVLQSGTGGESGSSSENIVLESKKVPTGRSGSILLETGGATGMMMAFKFSWDGDLGNGGDVAISAGTTWSIGDEGGIVAAYGGEGIPRV